MVWPIFDEEEERKGRHTAQPARMQDGCRFGLSRASPLLIHDWHMAIAAFTRDRAVWPGRPHTEVK